jgi:hypothetical protein
MRWSGLGHRLPKRNRGRDRVPAIRGSRSLTALQDHMVKLRLKARNIFAAREDARPPGLVRTHINKGETFHGRMRDHCWLILW